ncbi:hypothetical protein FQZ97_821990 [compost metagenome]
MVEILAILDAGSQFRRSHVDGLRHQIREHDLVEARLVVAPDRRLVPDAVDGLLCCRRRQVVLVQQDAGAHHHDGAALRRGAVRAGARVAGVALPCRRRIDGLRLATRRGEQRPVIGHHELRTTQVETPQIAVGVTGIGGNDLAGGVPHGDYTAQAAVAAGDGVAKRRWQRDEFLEFSGDRLHHVQADLLTRRRVVAAARQHNPSAVVQLTCGGVVGHIGQVVVSLGLVVQFPEKVILGRGPVPRVHG